MPSLPIITDKAPKKRGRKRAADIVVPLIEVQGTKRERLQALYNNWYGCKRCQLSLARDVGSRDEIVFGEGNPETADVIVVGEAPGEEEERHSIPFVGPSGLLLNQIVASVSDDPVVRQMYFDYSKVSRVGKKGEELTQLFNERMVEWRYSRFFLTNAVACRPPENRTPNFEEIKMCWERLWNIIYIVDPLLIIACGNSAISAVMRKVQAKVTQMRGNIYDVEFKGRIGDLTYPVIPTFHPSYLLRKADWRVKGGDWEKTIEDWRKAMRVLDFLRNRHYNTPIPQR